MLAYLNQEDRYSALLSFKRYDDLERALLEDLKTPKTRQTALAFYEQHKADIPKSRRLGRAIHKIKTMEADREETIRARDRAVKKYKQVVQTSVNANKRLREANKEEEFAGRYADAIEDETLLKSLLRDVLAYMETVDTPAHREYLETLVKDIHECLELLEPVELRL